MEKSPPVTEDLASGSICKAQGTEPQEELAEEMWGGEEVGTAGIHDSPWVLWGWR